MWSDTYALINCSAAITTLKSKNLIDWIPSKVACFAPFDRIETPAVWQHESKWYMYAGEVTNTFDENFNKTGEDRRTNSIYVANDFEGPYIHLNRFSAPQNEWAYIGKTLTDIDGESVFVMNNCP